MERGWRHGTIMSNVNKDLLYLVLTTLVTEGLNVIGKGQHQPRCSVEMIHHLGTQCLCRNSQAR